jgi:hypothetical protein
MIDLVYAGGGLPSTYEVFVLPDVRFWGGSVGPRAHVVGVRSHISKKRIISKPEALL